MTSGSRLEPPKLSSVRDADNSLDTRAERNEIKYFIYVSRCIDPRGPSAIPEIIQTARRENAIHGITGVLMFDGERFCQYIEGEADDVNHLSRAIAADQRHAEFRVVAEAEAKTRRFRVWSMAYAYADDSSLIDAICSQQPAAAPDFFQNALSSCDVGV